MTTSYAHQCFNIISKQIGPIKPKIGIILGSGLGAALIQNIEQSIELAYEDLPNFPLPSIKGHAGKLHIGYLNQVAIACLQGRGHLYEGISIEAIKTQIRTLQLLGVSILIITNAAGSLDPSQAAGSLMLINDHINFQGINPLAGPNDENFGPRFIDMENAYDRELRALLAATGREINIDLPEGVYLGVVGPSFETPAEIRAFKTLGADLVGMSTVSEVILARHSGLRVAAISAITNAAAGLTQEKLSHEHTLMNAQKAERNLTLLLYTVMGKFKDVA